MENKKPLPEGTFMEECKKALEQLFPPDPTKNLETSSERDSEEGYPWEFPFRMTQRTNSMPCTM
ncbi:hypothetical protein PM082_015431 [Marasmius tenuissimus]|nr:hypothetical protein PM082_015431 [Marasmius tenuissimus]